MGKEEGINPPPPRGTGDDGFRSSADVCDVHRPAGLHGHAFCEARRLKLADFDAAAAVLRIARFKTSPPRTIPLHASAVGALQRYVRMRRQCFPFVHAKPITTHGYIEADLKMKADCLRRLTEPHLPERKLLHAREESPGWHAGHPIRHQAMLRSPARDRCTGHGHRTAQAKGHLWAGLTEARC